MARQIRSRTSTAHKRDRNSNLDRLVTIERVAEPRQVSDKKVPAVKKREPLLTLQEVAEILRSSVKQVRRYIADEDPRERLACIDMGRGRPKRVDPSDLETFIRVHRRP